MDEQAVNTARERIMLADRRLVALQEAGVDTSALISHLSFARAAIDAGHPDEAVSVVEEVLASASRLADGAAPAAQRRSSTHLRAVRTPNLAPEMVAKAITVHELDKRIEETCAKAVDSRMIQLGERLEAAVATVGTLTADLSRLRPELEQGLARLLAEQADALRTQATQAALAATQAALADLPTRADLDALASSHGDALRIQAAEAATAAAQAALADLPTRTDLEKLGESLRKDLDWQVERVAAERGWCSMADVDAALERTQGPGAPSVQPISTRHPRLESVLADFVRQLQVQQDRLIGLVQERAGAGAPGAIPPPPAAPSPGADGDLDALTHSSQFRVLRESGFSAEAPPPALAPASAADTDDDRATRLIAHPASDAATKPTTPTAFVAAPAEPGRTEDDHESSGDLRPATMPLASRAEQVGLEPDADRIVAAVAAEMAAQGGSSKLVRSGESAAPLSPLPDQAEVDALLSHIGTGTLQSIASSLTKPPPTVPTVTLPPAEAAGLAQPTTSHQPEASNDTALRERVLRLLPDVLADQGVRQRILALVASEALQPGVLGELTGIRAFIRREIRQAAEEVAAELRRDSVRERQPA